MSRQNWENTGPYILGLGNYRYADYALTCPMLIADLLCCLRAPYKVTGALIVHAMLLSGVVANFYYGRNWPKGGKGPAIAWFCFSAYWYIVAFFGLLHIVRVQYTKLAQLAENTDAKKALLPLRIAIVTIFTLWLCYPIVWIIGDQGIGFFSFSTVECIHAFCDIVAKSVYGFTLARFKSYYDKKLCQLLDECGMDGEEEFEDVEKRLQSSEGAVNESIAYAKARTPRGSKRRIFDADADYYSGGDDDHPHPPPFHAGRPHERHTARRISVEAAPASAEQMSDTMVQIENLNRQLAELMRTGRPV